MKPDFIEKLKEKDLSLTSVRLAVLNTLHDYPHADANTLYNAIHDIIPTASLQAVYNNLNTLVEKGIIREIKPKGQVSLYETRIHDNHHHIVCRDCHAVMDTDCNGCAPCLTPVADHGFMIDEAEVIFWGKCPTCQKHNNL